MQLNLILYSKLIAYYNWIFIDYTNALAISSYNYKKNQTNIYG